MLPRGLADQGGQLGSYLVHLWLRTFPLGLHILICYMCAKGDAAARRLLAVRADSWEDWLALAAIRSQAFLRLQLTHPFLDG